MHKIMIIDDDELLGVSLKKLFDGTGYNALVCESGSQGIELFERFAPDIVLLDIRLGDMDGLDVLRELKRMREDIPVIIMTAYGTIEHTVKAMQEGAFDYIQKPFKKNTIQEAVEKGLKDLQAITSITHHRLQYREKHGINEIIGESTEMKKVYELVGRFAKSDDTTILIEGESGTGKELIAQYIHFLSPRFDKPLVKLNCGCLSDTLAESELFGYERGAFTGGLKEGKPGKFSMAEGGTLFLDEVAELSSNVQTKLLRVLEERTYFRVGGTREITCNVRVVAATNKNLLSEVRKGHFREDLYYRLNALSISIPPLRERKEDIIPLASYFLSQYCKKYCKRHIDISPEAEEVLRRYRWEGNVRELRNVMERVILMENPKVVYPEHIESLIQKGDRNETIPHAITGEIFTSGITYDEMVKKLLTSALCTTQGNQLKASRLLGISRAKLRYNISKYRLNLVADISQ
ncbi:MAG: sigma-54-dependent Fis family transcriptional regulator [Deltaproteobacteria bacterium]|nr:sigma-54-dependent Fis family transcriptional regulator [Deltaproteobacteria bacterium]MBW2306537.1 sigma-54-dependent Fis family transcriptional regulator [Deltaproteobacteria bacterium]